MRRTLSPKQRREFLARAEVPQLVTYLRRHGRTWLESIAARSVQPRGKGLAQLRLADWIEAARDHSARSQMPPVAVARPRRVKGLPPPQQYGDET